MENGKHLYQLLRRLKLKNFRYILQTLCYIMVTGRTAYKAFITVKDAIITEDLDCLQSAFSLKMRLVLISSSAWIRL